MMPLVASILIKATLVAAITLIVVRASRRSRASVRHLVLTAGFAVLLVLPIASVLGQFVGFDVPVVFRSAPTPVTADQPDATEPAAAALGWIGSADVPRGEAGAAPSSPSMLLLWIWAAGVCACFAPVVIGVLQLRRYRRFGVPLLRERTLLQAVAAQAGVTQDIQLLRHEAVAGPMTYGVLLPVIFLPYDSRTWQIDAVKRALVHELEHIRRRDWLVHCASRIVCAAYWFHPLVWMMWRQLALEAERACDDAVLHEADATEYADQLVDLAARLSAKPGRPQLAMAGRDELRTRIAALLDRELPRGRAGRRATGVVALATVATVVMASARAVTVTMPPAQPSPQVAAPAPAAARPSFEAASIKISRSGGPFAPVNLALPGGRVTARNTLLRLMIAAAYQPGFPPRRSQMSIIGLPAWDETEPFDLDAVAPGAPTVADKRLMLQSLLADRFTLVLHPETRPGPVFELVLVRDGRPGPQLTPHSPSAPCLDPAVPPPAAAATVPAAPPPPPPCGGIRVTSAYWGGSMTTRMAGNGVTLKAIAERLSWFQDADRTVIDVTRLDGLYDFAIEWTPTIQLPPPAGTDPRSLPVSDKPVEFTALQEQLGLRLQPATGPIDVLMLDRVERPTGN